jgi:hypothetical protein
MVFPASLRSFLPLVVGLAVGGVGATLFRDSLPGAKGSPEERVQQLEVELKKARNRLAALEAETTGGDAQTGGKVDAHGRVRRGPTLADGARGLAEKIRAGQPVSPEDIFRASQPLIRDLAPLFDRMRLKQQREIIDTMSGELARKYQLMPEQQATLRSWFERRAEEEAKRWAAMLGSEGTRLEDVVRATHDVRMDEGIETVMQGVLSPEKFSAFKTERLQERAERLQKQADRKVQRLDGIVGLDEAQRDQVFGIMARGSREYDPAMVLEGAGGPIAATPAGDPKAAMLAVLTPDQRAKYEVERQRQRERASKDLEAIGLTLPADWDLLDDQDFR